MLPSPVPCGRDKIDGIVEYSAVTTLDDYPPKLPPYTHLRVWVDGQKGNFAIRGNVNEARLYLRAALNASVRDIESTINKQMLEEAIAREINVTGHDWPNRMWYVDTAFTLLNQIKEGHGYVHPDLGRDMIRLLIRLLGVDPDKCQRDTNGDGDCGQSFCPVCGPKKAKAK